MRNPLDRHANGGLFLCYTVPNEERGMSSEIQYPQKDDF